MRFDQTRVVLVCFVDSGVVPGAGEARNCGGQDTAAWGAGRGEERRVDAAQPAAQDERGAQHSPLLHRRQTTLR